MNILALALLLTNPAQAEECTDFSGFWKGECVDSFGTEDPSFLAFEQTGCHSVNVGLTSFRLEGTNSSTWANAESSVTRTDAVQWDSAAKDFLVIDMSLVRSPFVGNLDLVVQGDGTIKRPRKKRLNIQIQGMGSIGGGAQFPFSIDCSYKRAGRIPRNP